MRQILSRSEIENVLRQRLRSGEDWALLNCAIRFFEPFRKVYASEASNQVLAFTVQLLKDVVDEIGSPDDVIGDLGEDGFAVITQATAADLIVKYLKSRFNSEILEHHSLQDRERGYVVILDESGKEQRVPLMQLMIGKVSATDFFNRSSSK